MSHAPQRSAPPPPPPEVGDGASPNERLLAAAKQDNEELLESALEQLTDVNYADGLGNTALHYAAMNGSTDVLESILEHESCDPDVKNRLNGDTALHIAVRQRREDQPGVRLYIVALLLENGADSLIKNRHNERAIDLLPPPSREADPESDDEKVRSIIRRAQASTMVASAGDVVVDDEDIVDPNDIASDSD